METQNLDAIATDIKTFTTTTKSALDKQSTDLREFQDDAKARLLAIEQKICTGVPGGPMGGSKSLGELVIESDEFRGLLRGAKSTGQIQIPDFKTAIVNATANTAQPLVEADRQMNIIAPGVRKLRIRDLMPNLTTNSNVVTFTRELAFTNAAASQTGGSPNSGENIAKAESAMTFEMQSAVVETLAHWIPASRQILDDSQALQGYINTRLLYGLKLVEENQLLTGDGTNNTLSGLTANSTAFDTTYSSTSDTFLDVIRKAILQVEVGSNFPADAVIMNPRDVMTMQLIKTTGTASSGEYIWVDPFKASQPQVWGLPIVSTVAMAQGQFMAGAFQQAAAIWDRASASVEVSREHESYFIKNMIAILCECRLALTVFRPLAIVSGGFPYGS